jgi:hypothetical protein
MVDNMNVVAERQRVPEGLRSCHTAVIGGYIVEGHVPAAIVKRLLTERPKIVGIAVPGMPPGSPGMESPSPQAYDVIAFDAAGHTHVFAHVGAEGKIRP